MAVAFDAVGPGATGAASTTSPLTWTHTPVGTPTAVVVSVALGAGTDTGRVLAVTYGGTAMTSLGLIHSNAGTAGYVQLFGLASPASGAQTVSVSESGGTFTSLIGGSISFTGTDPVAPFGTAFTATGLSATASVAATGTTAGNMVVDGVCTGASVTSSTQTNRWLRNVNATTAAGNAASSTANGGGSVTMQYTVSSDWWGIVAVEVKAPSSTGSTDPNQWLNPGFQSFAQVGVFDANEAEPPVPDATFLGGAMPYGAQLWAGAGDVLTGPAGVTAGITAWFQADAITGLTDGASLPAWPDSSGSGQPASQAVAGSQPVYKTAQVNGLPVVRFDGTDDWMSSPAPAGDNEQTVFAVWKPTDFATGRCVVGSDVAGGLEIRAAQTTGVVELLKENNASIGTSTTAVSTTTFTLTTATFSLGSAAYAFYLNGVADGSGSHAQTLGASTVTIGRNGAFAGEYLIGDLAEVVKYNRVLTTPEQQAVEAYLTAKYALGSVSVAAGTATEVDTAFAASVDVTVNTAQPAEADTAQAATASVGVQAAQPAEALSAFDAAVQVGVNAQQPSVTGVAQDATVAIQVNAAQPTEAYTAYDTTVSSGSSTNAPAEQPTEALSAFAATVAVGANAGQPTSAEAAQAAAVALGVQAAQPSSTDTAQAASVATAVNAGQPTEAVAAQAATASVGANAGQPTNPWTANQATVTIPGATSAPAEAASVTVTAFNATVAMTALAQAAGVTVTAFDATVVAVAVARRYLFHTPLVGRDPLTVNANPSQRVLLRHYGGYPKRGVAVILWPDLTITERRTLYGDEHLTALAIFTGGRENIVDQATADILVAAGYSLSEV